MTGVVVDTSPLVGLERKNRPLSTLLEEIYERFGVVDIVISAITVAELEHGIHRAKKESQAAYRKNRLDELLRTIPVIPFTTVTARIVGKLEAEAYLSGVPRPYADLLIAGTAIELGYALFTGNVKDFRMIPKLEVVEATAI